MMKIKWIFKSKHGEGYNEQNSPEKIFPVTKKILKSKRGEGYIDVVLSVIVSMMLLVLTLNVFTFLTIKQDMDYFAKEMIFSATTFGKTTGEVDIRYSELIAETGLPPTVTWQV